MSCSYKVDVLPPGDTGISPPSDGDGDGDGAVREDDDGGGDGEGRSGDGDSDLPMGLSWGWCTYADAGVGPSGATCTSTGPCVTQIAECWYDTTVCEGTQTRLGTVRRLQSCQAPRRDASYCAARTTDCCVEISDCAGTSSGGDSLMVVCSTDCNQIVSDADADIYTGCPGTSWHDDGHNYRCTGDFICDHRGNPIGPDAPFEAEDGSLYWCENNVLQRVFVPRRY